MPGLKLRCETCGTEFQTQRGTARYCGGTCRQRANRAKAQKAEPSAQAPAEVVNGGCVETDIGPIPIEKYELDIERFPKGCWDEVQNQIHSHGASLEVALAMFRYDIGPTIEHAPTTDRQSEDIGGAFQVTLRAKPADKEYGVDYYPPYVLHNPNDFQ